MAQFFGSWSGGSVTSSKQAGSSSSDSGSSGSKSAAKPPVSNGPTATGSFACATVVENASASGGSRIGAEYASRESNAVLADRAALAQAQQKPGIVRFASDFYKQQYGADAVYTTLQPGSSVQTTYRDAIGQNKDGGYVYGAARAATVSVLVPASGVGGKTIYGATPERNINGIDLFSSQNRQAIRENAGRFASAGAMFSAASAEPTRQEVGWYGRYKNYVQERGTQLFDTSAGTLSRADMSYKPSISNRYTELRHTVVGTAQFGAAAEVAAFHGVLNVKPSTVLQSTAAGMAFRGAELGFSRLATSTSASAANAGRYGGVGFKALGVVGAGYYAYSIGKDVSRLQHDESMSISQRNFMTFSNIGGRGVEIASFGVGQAAASATVAPRAFSTSGPVGPVELSSIRRMDRVTFETGSPRLSPPLGVLKEEAGVISYNEKLDGWRGWFGRGDVRTDVFVTPDGGVTRVQQFRGGTIITDRPKGALYSDVSVLRSGKVPKFYRGPNLQGSSFEYLPLQAYGTSEQYPSSNGLVQSSTKERTVLLDGSFGNRAYRGLVSSRIDTEVVSGAYPSTSSRGITAYGRNKFGSGVFDQKPLSPYGVSDTVVRVGTPEMVARNEYLYSKNLAPELVFSDRGFVSQQKSLLRVTGSPKDGARQPLWSMGEVRANTVGTLYPVAKMQPYERGLVMASLRNQYASGEGSPLYLGETKRSSAMQRFFAGVKERFNSKPSRVVNGKVVDQAVTGVIGEQKLASKNVMYVEELRGVEVPMSSVERYGVPQGLGSANVQSIAKVPLFGQREYQSIMPKTGVQPAVRNNIMSEYRVSPASVAIPQSVPVMQTNVATATITTPVQVPTTITPLSLPEPIPLPVGIRGVPTPTPDIPPPGLPMIPTAFGPEGRYMTSGKGKKRKYLYAPSLTSLYFNIRGKKQRTTTGFEVRPVVR